jgi:hypothetical protein
MFFGPHLATLSKTKSCFVKPNTMAGGRNGYYLRHHLLSTTQEIDTSVATIKKTKTDAR